MQIDDRIGGMTDKELANLQDNAVRLAVSGKPAQRTEAERLIPIVEAEIEGRAVAAREALAAKKQAQREARVKTKKPGKSVEAA